VITDDCSVSGIPSVCRTCKKGSKDICESCNEYIGLTLTNGKCKCVGGSDPIQINNTTWSCCPANTFFTPTYVANKITRFSCNECPQEQSMDPVTKKCVTCPNCRKGHCVFGRCTDCADGYLDWNNDGLCEVDREHGFKNSKSVYEPCDAPCDTCAYSSRTCKTCGEGFTPVEYTEEMISGVKETFVFCKCRNGKNVNGKCVIDDPCDDGMPKDDKGGCSVTCELPGCKVCDGLTSVCKECLTGKFMIAEEGKCVDTCPDGYA
jgi:hypothetical protein